jgi:hypothetical protein
MPFFIKFQLTPIWQPNVIMPSLRININGNLSTLWTPQTADDNKTITDGIFTNMLFTTEDKSKSTQHARPNDLLDDDNVLNKAST